MSFHAATIHKISGSDSGSNLQGPSRIGVKLHRASPATSTLRESASTARIVNLLTKPAIADGPAFLRSEERLYFCGTNPSDGAEDRLAMDRDKQEDTVIYKVIINAEEQYSIWQADRTNPAGWKDVGPSGTKEECLAFIKNIWTDMRPLSLRKKMDEEAKKQGQ